MPDGTTSPVNDLEREQELDTPLDPHALLPQYREPRCALDCLLYFRPPQAAFMGPTPADGWPTPAPDRVPPTSTVAGGELVTAVGVDGDASQTTPTPSSPCTPTPSNPYPTVALVAPVDPVATPSPLASLIGTVAESLDAHGIDHFSVTLSPTLLGLLDHRLQWAVADTAAQRRYAWENQDSAFLQKWIADVEGIHRAAAAAATAGLVAVAAAGGEELEGGDGTSPTGSPATPTAYDSPPPRQGTLGAHDWATFANRWLCESSHFDRPRVPRGTWQRAPSPFPFSASSSSSMTGSSTCHIALRPPYAQTANLPWSDTERAQLLFYAPGGTVTHTPPPLCPQYVCDGLASGMSTWKDNVTSDTPFQCTPEGGGGGWAAQWARSEQVFAGARSRRRGKNKEEEELAPTLAALLDLSDGGYAGDIHGGLFRVLETLVTTLWRTWAPDHELGFGIRVVRDEADGLRLDLPFGTADRVANAFVAQHCRGGDFAGLEAALMYLVLTVYTTAQRYEAPLTITLASDSPTGDALVWQYTSPSTLKVSRVIQGDAALDVPDHISLMRVLVAVGCAYVPNNSWPGRNGLVAGSNSTSLPGEPGRQGEGEESEFTETTATSDGGGEEDEGEDEEDEDENEEKAARQMTRTWCGVVGRVPSATGSKPATAETKPAVEPK